MTMISMALLMGCPGPTDDDDVATDDDDDVGDDDTTPFEPPEWCTEAEAGIWQQIDDHPASPYFVHHPDTDALDVPTVLFLSGGPGDEGTASATFQAWLAGGDGLDQVRAVAPFAEDGDLLDEYDRSIEIIDEILACYGGDPASVHLGGTSNGGRGAFELMLDHPEPFATLLGAPGIFPTYPSFDDDAILAALEGKAVFNGVGETDTQWQGAVEQTHEHFEELGIDSVYVEFAGEGHILTAGFDETVFFDFWLAH